MLIMKNKNNPYFKAKKDLIQINNKVFLIWNSNKIHI